MPLFEYACRSCGHAFEYLTRAGIAPECPKCSSHELDKQLSVFAVSVSAAASRSSRMADAPAPCAACGDPRGAGACSIN
jgi:putative FmdB family regulatory protein